MKAQQQEQQQIGFNLKMKAISASQIERGDLIFKNGSIWMCVSKSAKLFSNMETKEQRQFSEENQEVKSTLQLNKLELIPISWKVAENNVIRLHGRELGMGPQHQITVSQLRPFSEMQIIISQKSKGRDIRHKVILCQTSKKSHYLIVNIELL